jgi:formate-dependent nitrite reductase membrane component NrfD
VSEPRSPQHHERSSTLRPAPRAGAEPRPGWDGPTYYGRPQLKSAPFNNWIVGGYIFLAGLSGSSSLLGAICDGVGGPDAADVGRRARRLGLLAPTVGAGLLIKDLHTPQRFYNMLRIFKPRSPMSIGTWILMGYGASAVPAALFGLMAQVPGLRWLRRLSGAAQLPAAAAGAGLSVYTAPLLSATSTPSWAAAPRALAVRFGASSLASAAAALSLGERNAATRRRLQLLTAGALGVEAAAAVVQDKAYKARHVEEGVKDPWGKTEKLVATGLGVAAPLALLALGMAVGGRRGRALGQAAALATIGGSLALRVSTLGMGDESALRPEVSLRFAQPDNLPKPASGARPTGDVDDPEARRRLRRRTPREPRSEGWRRMAASTRAPVSPKAT